MTRKRVLDRRSKVLFILGFIWIGVGFSEFDSNGAHPALFHEHISTDARGIAWMVTGVVAIINAWRPVTKYGPGFLALYIMPALRLISYGFAWIDSWLPWFGEGYEQAWKFSLFPLAILVLIWYCSDADTIKSIEKRDADGQ